MTMVYENKKNGGSVEKLDHTLQKEHLVHEDTLGSQLNLKNILKE